jgi:hypothetical protein
MQGLRGRAQWRQKNMIRVANVAARRRTALKAAMASTERSIYAAYVRVMTPLVRIVQELSMVAKLRIPAVCAVEMVRAALAAMAKSTVENKTINVVCVMATTARAKIVQVFPGAVRSSTNVESAAEASPESKTARLDATASAAKLMSVACVTAMAIFARIAAVSLMVEKKMIFVAYAVAMGRAAKVVMVSPIVNPRLTSVASVMVTIQPVWGVMMSPTVE